MPVISIFATLKRKATRSNGVAVRVISRRRLRRLRAHGGGGGSKPHGAGGHQEGIARVCGRGEGLSKSQSVEWVRSRASKADDPPPSFSTLSALCDATLRPYEGARRGAHLTDDVLSLVEKEDLVEVVRDALPDAPLAVRKAIVAALVKVKSERSSS